MKTIKTLERLQQAHELIKSECTGSPKEFASRLKVSERTIYNIIDQLKDLDAEIKYDRARKTYLFNNDFELSISLAVSVLTDNIVTDVYSGSYFSNK